VSGSVLRGDVQAACHGARTVLRVDSDADPAAILEVVTLAKRGCFGEAMLSQPVTIGSTIFINGEPVEIDGITGENRSYPGRFLAAGRLTGGTAAARGEPAGFLAAAFGEGAAAERVARFAGAGAGRLAEAAAGAGGAGGAGVARLRGAAARARGGAGGSGATCGSRATGRGRRISFITRGRRGSGSARRGGGGGMSAGGRVASSRLSSPTREARPLHSSSGGRPRCTAASMAALA
jgi:hypothetical protein